VETNYREKFDSWRESCCDYLGSYENQNENWYGLENEEKANEKMNIGGKTRWYLTYSIAVESLWLVGQRHSRIISQKL